jgi:hypothetical protein
MGAKKAFGLALLGCLVAMSVSACRASFEGAADFPAVAFGLEPEEAGGCTLLAAQGPSSPAGAEVMADVATVRIDKGPVPRVTWQLPNGETGTVAGIDDASVDSARIASVDAHRFLVLWNERTSGGRRARGLLVREDAHPSTTGRGVVRFIEADARGFDADARSVLHELAAVGGLACPSGASGGWFRSRGASFRVTAGRG